MDDFMLGLLDDHVQPLADIGGDQVHQAESGHDLMFGHEDLLLVQEYKLYLGDGEDHAGARSDGYQNVLALWVTL